MTITIVQRWTVSDPELQQIVAQTVKEGTVMQEREILLGIDL